MESRESVLKAVEHRWDALRDVGDVWKGHHEVVLTAVENDARPSTVQHDGRALLYAAEALKGDHEVVLTAVQHNGRAL
eukprot:4710841-Amphidinium_carterae.1